MEARLLKRFYSNLLLVCALCPPGRVHDVEPNRFAGWRRFLNDLCWFCDTKRAGETVVTIAVEQMANDQLVFLLACNEGRPKSTAVRASRAAKYVQWVLAEMQGGVNAERPENTTLEEWILEKAVKISYDKVKNYVDRLRTLVKELESDDRERPEGEVRVHAFATSLLGLERSRKTLSTTAYEFRQTAEYQDLRAPATTPSATAKQWAQVRHYIGRLASWAKSARCIARMAGCAEFRPYLPTAEVRALRSLPAVAPNPLRPATDWPEVLATALPDRPPAKAHACFNARLATRAAKPYAKKRLAVCTAPGFQPRVHAEIPMLKHFAPSSSAGPADGLRFAFDDRYIACSKPPCFACDLYREVCHADIAMRPRHGRVWVPWSLPCRDDDVAGPARLRDAPPEVERMIKAMRDRITKVLYQHPDLAAGGAGAGRRTIKFDSNTDIDTTLPRTASVRKCFEKEGDEATVALGM